MATEIADFIDLIETNSHIAAFTGAGISTLSGIRDFRGKNGIYNDLWQGYRVEELFSLELFLKKPELFYQWSKNFIYNSEQFQPNIIHKVLAALERTGKLTAVITQNIDRLHQIAGSTNVFEIHGSAKNHHCLSCGKIYDYETIEKIVNDDKLPICNCGGIVKPDIVFYGEPLDESTFSSAMNAIIETDILLVLGSSLTVYPAAVLPEEAYKFGSRIVIVNDTPTALDSKAFLKLHDLNSSFEILNDSLKLC